MTGTNRIPLTVGVTGHIDLRERDRDILFRAVKSELSQLRERYPHTPVKLLCSLAAGADLLCADAAEELGIPVTAVLPMPADDYRRDFGEADLAKLNHHLERAEAVFIAPAAEAKPAEPTRDFRYRQAGIWIAEHSHALLALWDGQPDESGCGTAAAVRFALEGDWQPVREMPVRSAENSLVIHIRTPRPESGEETAGEVRRLGDEPAWETMMARTEEFNTLAEDSGGQDAYDAADALSLLFARQYRRALYGLALAGTALTLAFLLYDEASLKWMILLCGAALVFASRLLRLTRKTACHRRFIEYRELAEALRVQKYLREAGSALEVQRLMTWTQRQETPWILCALCAVNAAPPPEKTADVVTRWVDGQREYHQSAGGKTAAQRKKKERILGVAMRISALVYLVTLAYELVFGGMLFAPLIRLSNPETGRTVIKIVLGTLSAATLFMAGYYGKMSLERVTADHEKMEKFYEKAADRLARCGQNEQILEVLVREELTENGNWSSYQRDNAPEMNV